MRGRAADVLSIFTASTGPPVYGASALPELVGDAVAGGVGDAMTDGVGVEDDRVAEVVAAPAETLEVEPVGVGAGGEVQAAVAVRSTAAASTAGRDCGRRPDRCRRGNWVARAITPAE